MTTEVDVSYEAELTIDYKVKEVEMKLGKAIGIVTNDLDPLWFSPTSDIAAAIKIVIEAAKRLDFNRRHYPTNNPELLPGETI